MTKNQEFRHRVLVGLEARGSHHWEQLKRGIEELQLFSDVERVSSIYEVTPPEEDGALKFLSVAVSLETNLLPLEFRDRLEASFGQHKFVVAQIFLIDDEFRMGPHLTLPHPELHLKPHWVIPASELWGNYAHPVLNLPLSALAGRHSANTWGSFFAQGKMLFEK